MFRGTRLVAPALCLGACSFVLDDPTPFSASRKDAAPDAAEDAARDAAPSDLPDVFVPPDPDRQMRVDMRAPPRDMAPRDAVAAADAAVAVDATPDAACVSAGFELCNSADDDCDGRIDEDLPAEEICNGRDDDCDGSVDETDPRACTACGPAGARGLCAVGAFVCVDGQLRCGAWLPEPGPAVACDDLDNDCDGALDEAGEEVRVRDALEQVVVDRCGPRAGVDFVPAAGCPAEPRVVGCAPAHACVDTGCRRNCLDDAASTVALCDPACARDQDDPIVQAACRAGCRAPVTDGLNDCLAACGRNFLNGGATRWSCEGGDDGPACTALDCPAGTHAAGQRCERD